MTLTKHTVIDQIEIKRDGFIQIRFNLLIEEDGTVLSSTNLRTALEPGGDLAAQMQTVNDYLAREKLALIDEGDMPLIQNVKAVVQTPDVVKKYQDRAEAAALAQTAQLAEAVKG